MDKNIVLPYSVQCDIYRTIAFHMYLCLMIISYIIIIIQCSIKSVTLFSNEDKLRTKGPYRPRCGSPAPPIVINTS